MTARLLSAALGLAFAAVPAAAETEPLETDRPDITEAPGVVGEGRFQIETSVQREHRDGRGSRERFLSTPTLLRAGISDRWEARLETDGFGQQSTRSVVTGTRRASGFNCFELGTKYALRQPASGSRQAPLGVLAHVQIPSGSGAFAAHGWAGTVKLASDFEPAPRWSLGTNLGMGLDEESPPFAIATAALGYELTTRLRPFLEVAAERLEPASARRSILFDGGLTWLLNPDTQLDAALGAGISGKAAPDFFWTVGFSRRF